MKGVDKSLLACFVIWIVSYVLVVVYAKQGNDSVLPAVTLFYVISSWCFKIGLVFRWIYNINKCTYAKKAEIKSA